MTITDIYVQRCGFFKKFMGILTNVMAAKRVLFWIIWLINLLGGLQDAGRMVKANNMSSLTSSKGSNPGSNPDGMIDNILIFCM